MALYLGLNSLLFLLSSGLGHNHRCHRAMRWWDGIWSYLLEFCQDGDTQPALRTLWSSCLYHLITEHTLGGACVAGASAGLSCLPGNFRWFTQRGDSEAHDWWLVVFLKAYSSFWALNILGGIYQNLIFDFYMITLDIYILFNNGLKNSLSVVEIKLMLRIYILL